MARPAPDPGAAGRDPDILTAGELAARLGLSVQTIRDLSAAEEAAVEEAAAGTGAAGRDTGCVTLHGWRIGRGRLYSWSAVYEQIAGPGVADGEIVDLGELARRLGVPKAAARRALAPPGTPGKLPGRKVGDQWRAAWEAVQMQIRGQAPASRPGSPAAR